MNPSDRPRFVELIAALSATFGKVADEATFMGYDLGLSDLPIQAIAKSVGTAIRTCKFMPTVVELRQLAGEVTPQTRAVMAWKSFSDAVQRLGYYHSVNFDDGLINATVRNLGGWERVCDIPVEEYEKFFRKEFERVYLALLASGLTGENARYLPGYYERENRVLGQEVKPPVQVLTGLPPHKGVIEGPKQKEPVKALPNHNFGLQLRKVEEVQ